MSTVIRVIRHEGTEVFIARCIRHSLPFNGVTEYPHGRIVSTVVSADAAPCMLCADGLTSNTTLICDKCQQEALEESLKVEEGNNG